MLRGFENRSPLHYNSEDSHANVSDSDVSIQIQSIDDEHQMIHFYNDTRNFSSNSDERNGRSNVGHNKSTQPGGLTDRSDRRFHMASQLDGAFFSTAACSCRRDRGKRKSVANPFRSIEDDHTIVLSKVQKNYLRCMCLNRLLLFLSISLILAFMGTVIYVVLMISRLKADHDLNSMDHFGYCVPVQEIKEFQRIVGGELSYSQTSDVVCFKDLSWIARIVRKMFQSLQIEVKDAEKRLTSTQRNLKSSGLITLPTLQTKPASGEPILNQGAKSLNRSFAHLFLDTEAIYSEDDQKEDLLKWTKEESVLVGTNLHPKGIQILRSGRYVVYSHIAYRNQDGCPCNSCKRSDNVSNVLHRVIKNYGGRSEDGEKVLFPSPSDLQNCLTFSQGVYKLTQNDVLSVTAPGSKLHLDSKNKFSYFGAYLISE